LRTVIWEFCDEPIPDLLFQSLDHLEKLMQGSEFCRALDDLISSKEIKAFRQRIAQLVSTRQFPKSRAGRNVPYPPI
jgi:hypothetical protein